MNCQKYTRNQASNILVHCNRSDPNRTYGNQEIDHTKTYLNYNLAPKRDVTDFEFMKNRCEEFNILKRQNVNWMVSWVVTMPQDYVGNKELFFDRCYEFLTNKYGESNVISAYVHYDETSPHLHFTFVPVVFNVKKQEYKVNAKQCINKYELQKIHTEIQEYLEKELQTKVNMLNGATKEGNKTIKQLKAQQEIIDLAVKELVENPTEQIIDKAIEQLDPQVKNLLINDQDFTNKIKEEYMQELKEQKTDLKLEIGDMEMYKFDLSDEVRQLEREKQQKTKECKEIAKDDPGVIELAIKDLSVNPTPAVLSRIIDKQMEDIKVPSSSYEPVDIKRISADEAQKLGKKEAREELKTKIAEVNKLSMQNYDLHQQNKNMKDILNVSKNSKNLANTTKEELNDLEKEHTLTKSELAKLKEKYGKLESTFHFFIKKVQNIFFWVTNMFTQQQQQQNQEKIKEIKNITADEPGEVILKAENGLDEQIRKEIEEEKQRQKEEREKRYKEHDCDLDR